jgi:hypothetical protein
MGGGNIRAFASLFRDEVAGMVFVDPLNENIFRSIGEKEKEAEIALQDQVFNKASAGQQAE